MLLFPGEKRPVWCNTYFKGMSNGVFFVVNSELKKLSEESLTRQPEEVFDIICKLGEGYYIF